VSYDYLKGAVHGLDIHGKCPYVQRLPNMVTGLSGRLFSLRYATGVIYGIGRLISNMMTYINQWPHINGADDIQ
jgi:hypothetical protein